MPSNQKSQWNILTTFTSHKKTPLFKPLAKHAPTLCWTHKYYGCVSGHSRPPAWCLRCLYSDDLIHSLPRGRYDSLSSLKKTQYKTQAITFSQDLVMALRLVRQTWTNLKSRKEILQLNRDLELFGVWDACTRLPEQIVTTAPDNIFIFAIFFCFAPRTNIHVLNCNYRKVLYKLHHFL